MVIKQRLTVLEWPQEIQCRSPILIKAIGNLKVTDVLTEEGALSIPFLAIRQRIPNGIMADLSENEVNVIRRFIKWNGMANLIIKLIRLGIPLPQEEALMYVIPTSNYNYANLNDLTSKEIRVKTKAKLLGQIIMLNDLTEGETITWGRKIKKLKSTRHKNIVLRVAHGDIYSNERLTRFGMLNDSKCNNCDEAIENITHRFVNCPKTKEIWNILSEASPNLWYALQDGTNLKQVLGCTGDLNRLELKMIAEVITRINSQAGKILDPKSLVPPSPTHNREL